MKLLPYLFALILLIPENTLSQSNSASNYTIYNKEIIKARLAACEGDYEKAAEKYANIFKRFDFEFARDCYNAIENISIY